MYDEERNNLDMPCVLNIAESTHQMGKLNLIPEYSYGLSETDNCLIQGDNLHILQYLTKHISGKVKCVYLDPPYNNGESYLHYYDNMGHDQWIENISKRLLIIRELLSSSGSLWISIDDSELHYLKVAADKIFGRENFVSTIIWEKRTTRENRKAFSRNHEYILVYAKKASLWNKVRNTLPLTKEATDRYKNPDQDPRGPWQSVTANVQAGHATPQQFYTIISPSGKTHNPPKGRCWVYPEYRMIQEISANNIWFGKDGNGVPRIKKFLADRKEGLVPETLWRAETVGTTSDAKKHLLELFSEISLFDTPKPEQLIAQILKISTNPGDLVLDAYLGSGTTCAVSHKMNRKYIGIEIGSHIRTHCASRLVKVVNGEQGGITDSISWIGGGGFKFYKFEK
ncbi:TPA: site-specific DNA-methyltransferase [Klebsiella pneumoniae]|uniref:site-specific DNA-methyltransferase n=1 Tax=Enterobacteriaceae TaxID=543 RepID=UPI0018D88E68|nr:MULTISPECIES: site-specific DNA-methyltransferase [Enterobacteriaceae]MBH2729256.1 site-specific DNA-methyltransferase [Serratia marcescens]MBW4212899.1 site-specific DNA-methyltransferase [Enterobacter asburiae]MCQ0703235.1 site-specific DNA-methyltransferase [Klebsiella pneumoniae]WNJ35361.1 site-specific DNA-methyltransferase [Enterobacter hormaechei subsp. hormaechei]HBZ9287938.1 site-specific DNA-methyltransferase [Klebsiella pneumoniae]